MTVTKADGRTLAARFLSGLNEHDPDAVDGFVAVDYINHNPFVGDGREANRAFWSAFFTAFPDIEATMDDRVQFGIDPLDALDRGFHELERARVARADEGRLFGGVEGGEVVDHERRR